MTSSMGVQRALPAAVLVLFALVDLLAGPGQVVLGLVVISPLVAATALGRQATLAYGLVALAVAALLGVYDHQYTADTVVAQSIRLFGVALGTALALGACSLRMRREAQLAALSAQAAASRAALRMAESLQVSLLGDPPAVPGLQTTVRYLPAGRHASVGGDWYDAFALPDGTTMLVIGDVAGHDAPAAATMAQVRAMVRALAQCGPPSPAALLDQLDTVLTNLALHTLVTVAVAVLDDRPGTGPQPADGRVALRWANAGHPPPVLARADGSTALLARPPERLLGVGPGARRTDHHLVLCPGDTLVLYTDGLVERRGAPLDDGFAWLTDEVSALRERPLEELCDELLDELGGRVDDDVALLAVRLPG